MQLLEKRFRNSNVLTQSITDLDQIQFFRSKINAQRSTGLPQITSPFLKKAVINLFSQNQSSTLAPIKRYHHQNQTLKNNQQLLAIQTKLGYQKKPRTKNRANETTLQKQKVGILDSKRKSMSESKYIGNILIKSSSIQQIETVQAINKSSNNKTKRKRMTTEQSNRMQSKELYKKLQQLNKKDKLNEMKIKWFQKQTKKQYKQSNFVMKHKINKDLYKSQKQQIKYIKTYFNNGIQIQLDKSIKIKNYINFFPNIITIQN